jgi:arylsulfatase A-like enzyme
MGLVNFGWSLPEKNRTLAMSFHRPMKGSPGAPVQTTVARFLKEREEDPLFYTRIGLFLVHREGDGYGRYAGAGPDPSMVEPPPYLPDGANTREDIAQFYGCVAKMDEAVGAILEALDATSLRENTLVVFTTDHGICFPGAKATLYDPGLSTALLMRWPDGIAGSQTRGELTSHVDLCPTLLEAAGSTVPGDMEGRSLLPLLQGKEVRERGMIFAEKNTRPEDIKRCVRTDRWKYIRNFSEGPRLLLTGGMETSLTRRDMGRDHLKPRPRCELYDLQEDPHETRNLSGVKGCEDIERTMASSLESWMKETADPVLRGEIGRPTGEAPAIARMNEGVKKKLAEGSTAG